MQALPQLTTDQLDAWQDFCQSDRDSDRVVPVESPRYAIERDAFQAGWVAAVVYLTDAALASITDDPENER